MKRTALLLTACILLQYAIAQPTKKDIKAANHSLELGISHFKSASVNLDGYKNALFELKYALNIMKGDMPEAALLYARALILNYGSTKSSTNNNMQNFPFYKEEEKKKLVEEARSCLLPLLKKDSSQADPYLALAMINMIFYNTEPARYQPWYDKALSLGNADTECVAVYKYCYDNLRISTLYALLDKANAAKDEALAMSLLDQLREVSPRNSTFFKYLGLVYIKYGKFNTAISYIDSIAYEDNQQLDLVKNICQAMPDARDRFRLMYTRIFSPEKRFMKPVMTYLYDELKDYAAAIENKPAITLSVADSLRYFEYANQAYQKAKEGSYYSAVVAYAAGFDQVTPIGQHHGFIGYHYNRALALALLNEEVYKKSAVDFIDNVLKVYGNDPATAQLATLKKKILAKEKLGPEMFMAKTAYYDELLARIRENDNYINSRPAYVKKEVKPQVTHDPYCVVPLFNNTYLEKMNKQAQNDINNWNSVTKYGQLYRQSPNARTAISRIASTYREIASYYGTIKEQATVRSRICKDAAIQAELKRVAETAETMIRNAEAQIGKWNEAGKD